MFSCNCVCIVICTHLQIKWETKFDWKSPLGDWLMKLETGRPQRLRLSVCALEENTHRVFSEVNVTNVIDTYKAIQNTITTSHTATQLSITLGDTLLVECRQGFGKHPRLRVVRTGGVGGYVPKHVASDSISPNISDSGPSIHKLCKWYRKSNPIRLLHAFFNTYYN